MWSIHRIKCIGKWGIVNLKPMISDFSKNLFYMYFKNGLSFFKIPFLYMGVLHTCMPDVGPEECTTSPRTGIIDCCKCPSGCWESNMGPPQEVLLTIYSF